MGLLSNIWVASSGLHAADAGVQTTSHNVANISTEGFHRRSVRQTTSHPVQRGQLWIGRGAEVTDLARPSDRFLLERGLTDTSTEASSSSHLAALRQLESFFEDGAPSNLRQSLDHFFDTMNKASLDPADPSLRLSIAHAGVGVANAVSGTAMGFDDINDGLDSQIENQLPVVDELLQQVAGLNGAIRMAGGALSAGDLADHRDHLLRQLSKAVGTTVHFDSDGQADVFLGGHALVSGDNARSLAYSLTPDGPMLTVSNDSGQLDATEFAGGNIGGWLTAREQAGEWHEELNTFAADFATAMNGQHGAGFDRMGNPGGQLFNNIPGDEASSLTFDSVYLDEPELLAFAGSVTANPGDGTNLIMLHDMRGQLVVDNKTPLDWATAMATEIGSTVAQAESIGLRDATVLADTEELYNSLHSVDLDEEAANLLQYQAAYQAAARVVRTTDELLGTLMELT